MKRCIVPLPIEVSLPGLIERVSRTRAYWFAVGVLSGLTIAGFVAGIFHWPN